MREIKIKDITGFYSKNPVIIFDENLKTFYEKINVPKNGLYFNLPKGIYYTFCNIQKLSEPIKQALPILPKPEKKVPFKKIRVKVGENKNKATINISTGEVLLDKNIFDAKKQVSTFILLHEIGHFFYYSEEKCDLFAAYFMLKNGYNRTQIAHAIDAGLSSRSDCRKKQLFNEIKG